VLQRFPGGLFGAFDPLDEVGGLLILNFLFVDNFMRALPQDAHNCTNLKGVLTDL
jgi:hypothetical protein